MMRIVITGTPGTGKTMIARLLAQRTGWKLVDLKEFVNENRLFKKGKGAKEVDVAALGRRLRPRLSRFHDYIVEGHLACEFRIPADFVFVLRTHPKKLMARLSKRRYPKRKLDENLEAEMLDYCVQRAQRVYGKMPLELDTTSRTIPKCVTAILKAVKHKKKKLDTVDYSDELKRHLRLRP
jgi:adenylate kinase